jgi:ATP/maltotriose-dependent transcriptional regulator MalT
MPTADPAQTQRPNVEPIVVELARAGFEDAALVGKGGFGAVYRCVETSLDRTVAIKVLDPNHDDEDLTRFVREQRAMGRLSGHPNIVGILHVNVTDRGEPYIVMPYHARGSIHDRISDSGPLGFAEVLRIGVKIAGALETAHLAGILHRDVKPANVLVSGYGEPQLADFGISRVSGAFETSSEVIMVSPAYSAPEVLAGGPPTVSSDVYGLAATLFAALTGYAAYGHREGEGIVTQFLRISKRVPTELHDASVPAELISVIERAMANEPGDRQATAAEFGAQLQQVQEVLGFGPDSMTIPGVDVMEHGVSSSAAVAAAPGVGKRRLGSGTSEDYPHTPSTRFRPPAPARRTVVRDRLITALEARPRRLTLIHGPAGFGKSTLAAQWRDKLLADGADVAWLTVDDDDRNGTWFLAHLIEAAKRVDPALVTGLDVLIQQFGADAGREVLTRYIDQIGRRTNQFVLIIDDWHRVAGSQASELVEFLLDNGCDNLQLVVTSRTQAGLPISQLRVRDELTEVDATDMRFDVAETRAFIEERCGLVLDGDNVARLTDSTEGWAAAIQLATLTLGPGKSSYVTEISGRHHAIGQFLADNVVDKLDPEVAAFLLDICITERICGELAATLTGRDDAHTTLEEVVRQDLFIDRLGVDTDWYRIHHLFADFLRRRLERDDPGRKRELHRRAAQWFGERMHLSEAVDNALAADDPRMAVEIVERQGMRLLDRGQSATLIALTEKLPPAISRTRPRLQVAIAAANTLTRRPDAAWSALARVDSALSFSHLEPSEVADLRIKADVLRAVFAIFGDEFATVHELVGPALQQASELPQWLVSAAAGADIYASIHTFDLVSALRRQSWAEQFQHESQGPFGVMFAHCFAGIAASELLEIPTAELHYETAISVAESIGGRHSVPARLSGSLLGALRYEQGRLDEAERFLDASAALGSEFALVDFMIATYAIGGRLKALRHDFTSAAERLEVGLNAAEQFRLPRLAARIRNEQVRLGLTTPPPADTRQALGELAGTALETAEADEASLIGLQLRVRDEPARLRTVERARSLLVTISEHHRPRARLAAGLLLVTALEAAGMHDEASATLLPLLQTGSSCGLTRLFVDQGPLLIRAVTRLEREAAQRRIAPGPSEFMKSILAEEVLPTWPDAHAAR